MVPSLPHIPEALMPRHAVLAILVTLSALMLAPDARAQLDARDMEICRQQCMSRARDASDPRYGACVRTRCEGQAPRRAAPSRRAAAPVAPAAPAGQWALDTHDALGVSVHVQTEDGLIGVACAPEGVAIRVTNGMFRAPVLGWITDTGSAGGTIQPTPGAVHSEIRGSACALGVPGLSAATALVLVDAPVVPKGAGQGFGLTLPSGEVTVATGAEVQARFPGTRHVPVPGLAAGLGALAASCPPLAEALRQPCP